MIRIAERMKIFLLTLNKTFGDRVWFVGLQGSYARGESTADSDLDVVVILNDLTVDDLFVYHQMLDQLPTVN